MLCSIFTITIGPFAVVLGVKDIIVLVRCNSASADMGRKNSTLRPPATSRESGDAGRDMPSPAKQSGRNALRGVADPMTGKCHPVGTSSPAASLSAGQSSIAAMRSPLSSVNRVRRNTETGCVKEGGSNTENAVEMLSAYIHICKHDCTYGLTLVVRPHSLFARLYVTRGAPRSQKGRMRHHA